MKLTADERKSIQHALHHLEYNNIDCENFSCGGWYCGNREDFVKRHIKAKALLTRMLEDQK